MKKGLFIILLLAGCFSFSTMAQFKIGGKKIDVGKAAQAASDVATAVTLTDADIAKICSEYMEWMDEHNPIPDQSSEYAQRLKKLTGHITDVDGMKVNFAVYEVIDINAFASGDGSIRVFAGLMDVMDDAELMAIIGHEIGHIVNTDVKDAMKNAYLRSAAVNAAGSVSATAAKLGDSEFAAIAESLAGAQFSQKQENQADDYAFNFCIKNNVDPYGMSNALNKFVELFNSGGEKSDKIAQLFSTHPDSEKRAARMKEKADKYTK